MTSTEYQRHARELRRDRITLAATAALIAALFVLGAALAEERNDAPTATK